MTRWLIALLLSVWCAVLSSTEANAWSCGRVSAQKHVRIVDLFARGRITWLNVENGHGKARFAPTEIWKGTLGDEVELHFSDARSSGVGISLTRDREFVLSAYARPDGSYQIGSCTYIMYNPRDPRYAAVLESYRTRWKERLDDIKAHPGDVAAELRLANFLETEGDRPGARAAFERLITLRPDMAAAHAGLGRILVRLGSHEIALAPLERALELDPLNEDTLRLLQHTQIRMGQVLDYAQVDFRGFEVEGLDLSGQDLRGKDFTDAVLKKASFRGAQLDGATFDGAKLDTADFNGASLRHASFNGADLGSADFSNADMTGAVGSRTMFDLIQFNDHWKVDHVLHGGGLTLPKFMHSLFSRADVRNYTLPDHDVLKANILTTTVDEALYREARLSGFDLSPSPLDGADLRDARFNCATVLPEGIDIKARGMIRVERVCVGVGRD